jgi:DNA-binding LytR/AlgR family response regulator
VIGGVALVVDDEEHARAELKYLLGAHGTAVIEAGSASAALDILRTTDVEVVFLDIRMPGLDGLQLAEILSKFSDPPKVVFVTAHEEHAVEAFNLDAADYLVKPVTEERLTRTLQRLASGPVGSSPAQTDVPAEELPFVAVEVDDKMILIDRTEIRYIQARGDYVRLHTFDQRYLVRRSLGSIAKAWDQHGFVRVHRSYIVNLRHVIDISPHFNNTLVVRVKDAAKTVVPVSRRQASALRERLGLAGHG